MRFLILGGTVFLGRAMVAAAVARGHDVTIFHRGQHPATVLPATVAEILGDRGHDLARLGAAHYDAVVDTSGYVPRLVGLAATHLAECADRFIFISSLSVYPDDAPPGLDERATPHPPLADPTTETVTGETYGPLKALCEAAAGAAFGARTLIIRPGLIVGPGDPTDRFTYWPERVARGGAVLAPVGPAVPVQIIDARDLAEWIVRLAEDGATGDFNATGPATPLTLGAVLAECQTASDRASAITWVDQAFLLAAGVAPWTDLPLWVPEDAMPGFMRFDCRKAHAAGLTFRPLALTVRDTLAWSASRPTAEPRRAGLAPDREGELLRAWRDASGSR